MRVLPIELAMVGAALSLLWGGPVLATDNAEMVAKGKALLEKNCARCHAIGLEGASKHPKAPPYRVVVTRYPVDNLAEALAEGIMSGHPDMPELSFPPAEVDAILAYFADLKAAVEKSKGSPATP
jgi:mono/diheme cytochrome c family protein